MIGDQEYFTPQTTEMLPAFKAVNKKLQNTNIEMFFLSVLGSIYIGSSFLFFAFINIRAQPRGRET